MWVLISEVVSVTNDVRHACLTLADMNGTTLVLLRLTSLDHLSKNLRCSCIVIALKLNAVELLLKLVDALLLVL